MSSKKELTKSVRKIHISWYPSEIPRFGVESQACIETLLELIPKLAGLKRVVYTAELSFAMETLSNEESRWDHESGILPSLLRRVHQYHLECLVDVSLPFRQDMMSVLALFPHSPCLHTLNLSLDYDQKRAFEALHLVISTCSGLRKLSLISRTPLDLDDTTYNILRNRGHQALQLHTIEVAGPVVLLQESAQKCYAEFVDWSLIKQISLMNPINLVLLTVKPVSLRALKLGLDSVPELATIEAIKQLLCALFLNQRLEILEVSGHTSIAQAMTIDMLEPLGQTLRCLKVHGNEDVSGLGKRSVYSMTEIERLGQAMKRLETLGLDINYDGHWVGKFSVSFPCE